MRAHLSKLLPEWTHSPGPLYVVASKVPIALLALGLLSACANAARPGAGTTLTQGAQSAGGTSGAEISGASGSGGLAGLPVGVPQGGDAPMPGQGSPTLPMDDSPGLAPPHCVDSPPKVANGLVTNDHACWFEFHMPWDDASVNITNLSKQLDAPAGKYGYLKVGADGHFRFEDRPDRVVRFNGANLTATAAVPDKAVAAAVAARLARFGFNLVRITFEDDFSTGLVQPNSDLNPTQLDKLDYLIAELKKRGIYIHLDFHSSRAFGFSPGVMPLPTLGEKIGTLFDPTLIELQRSLIQNLLTHVNPYTGLAYKDDPAIPLGILANENSLFLGWVAWLAGRNFEGCGDCLSPYYAHELDTLYNDWLRAKYGNDAAVVAAWGSLGASEALASSSVRRTPQSKFNSTPHARIRDEARFYYELEGKYLKRLRDTIQVTLGSKMLVTMTTQVFGVASIASQAQGDFIDNNIYWFHPASWERQEGVRVFRWVDEPMVKNLNDNQNVIPRISHSRVKGKPLLVSEFNYNFPNSYQSEAPAMLYAFLGFLGADGVMWHAFHDFLIRTDTSDPNDAYLLTPFEIGASPHMLAQLPLAKPFLANDLKEADSFAEVALSESDTWDTVWQTGGDMEISGSQKGKMSALVQTPMVRSFFANQSSSQAFEAPAGRVTTGHGELNWDSVAGMFSINNAHWEGAVGFFSSDISLNHLRLENVKTTGGRNFASVQLVAMDSAPIESSEWLLLSTAARAENATQVWNEVEPESSYGRKASSLNQLGTGNTLLEPVRGRVGIQLNDLTGVEVWALDPRGNPAQKLASQVIDGTLWFDLGYPTLWYQIAHRR